MNPSIPQIPCASIETPNFNSSPDSTWFAKITAPINNEPETGAHLSQTSALQTYLAGQSTPSTTTTLLCSPQNPSENLSDLRSRVYALLSSALFEFPRRYTPSLITLLLEISNSNDPTWNGVPGFATCWSDQWKQPHWRQALATRDPSTRSVRREAHIHRAYVEASCAVATASSSAEEGLMPLSWGYECLSDALESHTAVLDFEVPAAATWIKVAGERLKEGAERGETSWALEREGRLWSAGAMSLERWEFWMRRLEEVEDVGNKIANAASEGLRVMRMAR